MSYKLGRIENFDERSKQYGVRSIIGNPLPRSQEWYVDSSLDQGEVSACVGFSCSHFLSSVPNPCPGVTNTTALKLYRAAQDRDEWPSDPPYEGSSVLGGFKAIKDLYPDAISSYSWCFGLDELVLAVGWLAPVVLGVNWYSTFFDPDSSGTIRIGGSNVGGHAILCRGVDITTRLFRLKNSWGMDYGIAGDCFIDFDGMARLLSERGEAAVGHNKKSVVIS